jgi:hypothetical protein
MKHLSTLILMLAIGLHAVAVHAQNYRPFRFGITYQLSASTAADTTHLLRLASRQPQGSDSVFLFDKRVSRGRALPNTGACGSYMQRADNLFGVSMVVKPGAEYVLTAANGRTFTLRPRTPVGQSWTVTAAGLTARVSVRVLGTVLGQPDSLATILLSDGAEMVLGKRFGWVSGPALGHYLNARLPQSQLRLTALPELRLGTNYLGAFAVYDFQPGDVFLRRTTSTYTITPGVQCISQMWVRDSIISRTLSANGDTLRYQQRSRTLDHTCPGNFFLHAPVVQTVRITRATSRLDQLTGFWEQFAGASFPAGRVHLPAWRTARFNQRPVQRHLDFQGCASATDSVSLRDMEQMDFGYHLWTATGLGPTREEFLNFFTADTTVLIGYRKGSETWGQLTPFSVLLPTQASRPASTTAAFPNPFGAELTVSFTLASPQPVALTLHDALGRVVREQAATLQPTGARQLALATAGLPAGVYTAHLRFGQEARTEVLKVLKAQ